LAFLPPAKRNLFIPRLFQLRYEQTLFDNELTHLQHHPSQLEELIAGKKVLIASHLGFYPSDHSLYRSMFTPRQDIMERANNRLQTLSGQLVGVHVRRTDNIKSIQSSPTEAFIDKMKTFPESQFYLATDSEDVKRQMRDVFSNRIITSSAKAARNTLEGMKDALCEMLILSRTSYFLGSYYSSFSDIILEINGKGEIVKKP